jgi:electron transfer flavoprotein alpha subunit
MHANETKDGGDDSAGARRPLRVAALIKQVPVAEAMTLRSDGRLDRDGIDLEMNSYCRRAVAKGCEVAAESGGTCTVFTLGPASAEDCLREAIAWGAWDGVHICDSGFAGSDTLATARALSTALRHEGVFDLILAGRNSVDGDTGQVGPEIAEMLDLPFAAGVRELAVVDGRMLQLTLEHDDGWEEMEVALPAVLSVAERLCDPCKVPPDGRARVQADRVRRLSASDLGPGPWGDAGSPTKVGDVRVVTHSRQRLVLSGSLDEKVELAVNMLAARGALLFEDSEETLLQAPSVLDSSYHGGMRPLADDERPVAQQIVAVAVEPERPRVTAELLGAARGLAQEIGGTVVAIALEDADGALLGALGADQVIVIEGSRIAEDMAMALTAWAREIGPWAVLVPSTAFGREVAGRCAAALRAGLVGDTIGVEIHNGRLVASKPAFSGALVADITCTSPIQMATIRPGVLPIPEPRDFTAPVEQRMIEPRGRVAVTLRRRDDDVEVLARAKVVIGLGAGVKPGDYERLSRLAAMLGAELAATRKVTDNGWAPRARQVGLTGRSISPRLYVAIGLSGKFNHMVGVRSAGTVLAINSDPEALVFEHCDIGIVEDWQKVLPVLVGKLHAHLTSR